MNIKEWRIRMKKKLLLTLILFLFVCLPIQANTKKTVTLSKCTDGDTAHFMVDGKDTTVRFLAVNAPEYTKEKEFYGKEASEYVCDRLTKAKQIELEYDEGSDRTDKYGRDLAWIFVDGTLLEKDLVKQGYAEVKYIYGDYAYTDELKALEKEAKAQKLGMWSDNQTASQQEEELPYMMSAIGGVILILAGTFFVKGKRNKKKLIKQGIKQIKRK